MSQLHVISAGQLIDLTEEREEAVELEPSVISAPEEDISAPSTSQINPINETTSNNENTPSLENISRASVQSTLDEFRPPPVLPNLALQALQRLNDNKKTSNDEDEFKPAKKRRLEEGANEDEVHSQLHRAYSMY